ncbi:LCP family protein [Streptantibioticus parmotrematis]|uniref:LCP family protein n=1 Tax=Streptantibioticus parmotrematis TaxID=2873249 RepID=UPI0033D93A4C
MTEPVDSARDGAERGAVHGSAPLLGGRRVRVHHAVRVAAVVVAGLLLLTTGAGVWLYAHLNGNLRGLPLFGGATGDAGREKPDAFGRTPVNVLVIGSDSRADPADCALGGDCGPGQNADVEMVVHLSADRSNATVMSVPRDTVTDLPACKAPAGGGVVAARHDQINSTLRYGPGCTVAAVHQLTGIPIDHFMMIGFDGVVRMSDAVGGVDVCVDRSVYDPYSHLKLAKGRHTLKGLAALEFLRSRHAFGDGSDLGRTYAQHLYLGSLVRRMKATGTLTDPAALYALADAATKALTVDTGLDSVPKLLGLAADLNKVQPSRVTFTTMQSEPDPVNPGRVVVAPAAQALFSAIAADRALTTPDGAKSAVATALQRAAATPEAMADLESRIAHRDRSARASGAPPGDVSVAAYAASALPGGSDDSGYDAHAETAGQDTGCASVSPYQTVAVGGVRMTPSQAFTASRGVPLSAP